MTISILGTPPSIFQGGRLTYQSGVPCPIIDLENQPTLFYTPYLHNLISYYDGSTWRTKEFPELSIGVPLDVNKAYDVFIFDDSGTLSLSILAWTDITVRNIPLARVNGILCRSDFNIYRYLGSFRTIANLQGYDSSKWRSLWNYYNRVSAPLFINDPSATWTQAPGGYRQANNNPNNAVEFFCGFQEDALELVVRGFSASPDDSDTRYSAIGFFPDSLIPISQMTGIVTPPANAFIDIFQTYGCYKGLPPNLGDNFFVWIEKITGTGTIEWHGQNNSGLMGVCKR